MRTWMPIALGVVAIVSWLAGIVAQVFDWLPGPWIFAPLLVGVVAVVASLLLATGRIGRRPH